MSARDELAEAIAGYRIGEGYYAVDVGYSEAQAIADDLIAAGYRKPRTITTVKELVALPNSAVIRDRAKDVAEKRGGLWCQYETSDMTDSQMAKFLPATVLDEGQA